MNVVSLVVQAGLVAKAVLLILLSFSLMSWTLIFMKFGVFRRGQRESAQFLQIFRSAKNLTTVFEESKRFAKSPIVSLFQEGYRELSQLVKGSQGPVNQWPAANEPRATAADMPLHKEPLDLISRTLRHASMKEVAQQERNLIFLATTGNVTPFVGLFGTVWGIMDAFASIGQAGSANLGAVAPGVAEALITTAAGLGAAIPAVIAYNYFVNRVRRQATEMELFGLEFLTLAERILARSR
ncbi:MAG: MotA/TolQ/ExbB proton channel family protein [candidate division NC10 bacterium]|nr:MotA/TolQ/ExbB proton channel family protein [candidate division NC10 bacterium]MDE2484418.1 MotA/TolQ/ExbB proton channel family protein [candidate division NC10 bacterium]